MDIEHEIHLQQNAPLPNISMYRSSMIESARDDDFNDVYEAQLMEIKMKNWIIMCTNNLLYHLEKIYIPRDERENVIKETHTSLIFCHFGVGKTIAQL